MEIIGYSERGAMNALFYGIALNDDKGAMQKFIKLANIEGDYTDFEVYSEFSLSDFGDPDMVIFAYKKEGGKDVIFMEAKASCGNKFNLQDQYKNHNEYVDADGEYESGKSSNLFFQLRQKYYFFETKGVKEKQHTFDKVPNLIKYYNQEKTKVRRTGSNKVVKKFMELISECTSAHYIAIIPESDYSHINTKKYEFDIHFIYWENLQKTFGKYLDKTIKFNQNGNYNQILNRKDK